MTPRMLIHAMGIPLRVGMLRWPPGSQRTGAPIPRGEYIGDPPNDSRAWSEFDDGGPVVVSADESPRSWCYAVHEAVHIMCGIESLADEGDTMPVEWALCQSLSEPWRSAWRRFFANAYLDDDDVGETDEFLDLPAWSSLVDAAHDNGWLHEGRPVWGMGVHPSILEARS